MKFKAILIPSILAALSSPGWALNILVANDDSCNAEGVNALMDALEGAGHDVTMVAPAGQQSGKSSSINTNVFSDFDISNSGFSGPTVATNRFCVRAQDENPAEGVDEEIVVSATPRYSVLVGLQMLQASPPDLVVTGINSGQNVGTAAVVSGTVGGAVAALQSGIPAIAVSRHRFATAEGMTYAQAAQLVVDVISELEAKRVTSQPLLPAKTALNINTPQKAPRGVVATVSGDMTDRRVGPNLQEDGVTVRNDFLGFLSLAELLGDATLAAELENNPDATLDDFANAGLDINDETSMFVAGYVTITTLDGDYTATLRKRELLKVKLRDLSIN